MISEGKLAVTDSPLLIGALNGHVVCLDEVDKCPPSTLASLRSLVQGFLSLPDGRCLVSIANVPLVERTHRPESILVIDPHFRLVCLANPGVFPFQGSNVLNELGSHFTTIVVDPPPVEAMAKILQGYLEDEKTIRIAKVFHELLNRNVAGELTYSYSLREAISVCKHLAAGFPLAEALDSVFSFERSAKSRALIYSLFQRIGGFDIALDIAETAAMRNVITHSHENTRIFKSGPKHGREPDGKPHVGGDTWAGGTGGSSTAGLGGKHGPYRRFDGSQDIHQLPDTDKEWSDPVAKAAAKKMAKEKLEERLRELDMMKGDFEAYGAMLTRVQEEVDAIRELMKALNHYTKRRPWKRGVSEGDLDEQRFVDALAGSHKIYKKRAREATRSSGGKPATIRIRLLVDISASMFRFNFSDQRLTRTLEMVIVALEGMQEGSENVRLDVCDESPLNLSVEREALFLIGVFADIWPLWRFAPYSTRSRKCSSQGSD